MMANRNREATRARAEHRRVQRKKKKGVLKEKGRIWQMCPPIECRAYSGG
jgi:hypothetical protein